MNSNSVSPTNQGISQISEGVPNSTKTLNEDIKTQQFEESFIFPLFSEISRVTKIPSIFSAIVYIIQIIQSLIANLYIGNLYIWKSFSSAPKSFRYLSYTINLGIIDLINKNNSNNNDNISKDNFYNCWPIYVSIIIFILIEIIFILILLLYYRKKRLFLKWTLYTANFIFSILNTILFAPICGILGYAFWQVDSHQSSSSIVFFILSIISTLFLLFIIVFSNNFACNSVYLSRSIDSCWNAKVKNLFTIIIGLSSFLAPVLNSFSKWFIFVAFLTVLFLNIYEFLLLHYLPYIKEIMNSVTQSTCLLSIMSIIMSIAHYFTDINSYVLIFVPVSIFVIFAFFFYFFNRYRIKSLLHKMNSNNEISIDNYIINGNDDKVIFYIHIGITYMSPIFVDYSIMKFIISVKQTLKILFSMIQITAMLPAQIQFLSIIVANVSAYEAHFNLTQKYILYQARKVNVIRQSVSSKEERSEAKLLFKMSEETISLVRSFWGEISHLKSDISTASLRYFRNSTYRTSSAYLDAIEEYPRSQKLYDQYIRFLIEAKGDFRESINYRKKLIMIEEGKKVVHDYAFRSFANTFPKYLTDCVFDVHGNYINKNDQIQSNDGNLTANNSQVNSNSGLDKSYHDDEISSTIFNHSKLRLALQDIIKKSTMKSLNTLRVFSIVTFLVISLIIIVLLAVITGSSDSLHSIIKSIALTSKILTSIQYTGLLIGTRLTEDVVAFDRYWQDNPDIINDFGFNKIIMSEQLSIDINTSWPEEPSLYNRPLARIFMVINDIRSYLQEEMTMIFSDPSLHSGEIFLFNNWILNSSHFAYYDVSHSDYQACNSLNLSLQGIISMVLRQIEFVSSTNASKYNSREFYMNQQFYTITLVNDIVISKAFDEIFTNISQNGIDICENYDNIYDILTYVISIVTIIFFFIFRLICFCYMKKEFNNLSHLLKGFSKEDIVESSKPIYLKNKEPLPTGTVHSAHDFSVEIYMLPFLYLLIIADCVIISAYMCIETQNYYETFSNVFEWSNGAAQRASVLMELVDTIHFDNCNYRFDFEFMEFANITDKVSKILKYQNLIDMEIIGKDSRFDDFYYFDHCKSFNGDYDFSDFADCLSVSNKINAAINQLINMNREFEDFYGILYSFDYAAMMYNIDKSIYSEFISFMDYLITFSNKITDENNNKIKAIGIIGIVILFILFIIENVFTNMLYNSLEGFKQLIYTISPISACRNRSLILFLSNKTLNEDEISTVDLILNNSQFSIVTINENLIIQTINQEFCKLTDYSSQKLLGQSITYLIPLPTDGNGKIAFESSPFYSAVNEMRENSSKIDSCSVKIKMRKEDLSIIHMNANLIRITDSSNSFKGVTLLLKSNEDNVEMKKKLEREKMNVNNLIKVLIPQGALNSVKGKKQSTFFRADEATLVCIEIAGMSDCISMMSPKGILDILQQIYNGIEKALKKFNTISMVRWENEMIFAVSGLFDTVGDFKKQSFETAAFMIEILQNLEETNIQTNTDFHLRLGAHIGGPVMGFIKDPINPNFSILSASFKYLNFLKENGPIDQPWITDSFAKHLDLSIFDIQKETTFVLDEIKEDIYSVKFKDGYRPLEEDISIKIKEEEEDNSDNNIREEEDNSDNNIREEEDNSDNNIREEEDNSDGNIKEEEEINDLIDD